MKKVLYYIPFAVFAAFYALMLFAGAGRILPIVWVWLLLLLSGGVLMGKNKPWGAFVSMLPAACLIYMGTRDTGQIVSETPIGIILLLYCALCYFLCRRTNKMGSAEDKQ